MPRTNMGPATKKTRHQSVPQAGSAQTATTDQRSLLTPLITTPAVHRATDVSGDPDIAMRTTSAPSTGNPAARSAGAGIGSPPSSTVHMSGVEYTGQLQIVDWTSSQQQGYSSQPVHPPTQYHSSQSSNLSAQYHHQTQSAPPAQWTDQRNPVPSPLDIAMNVRPMSRICGFPDELGAERGSFSQNASPQVTAAVSSYATGGSGSSGDQGAAAGMVARTASGSTSHRTLTAASSSSRGPGPVSRTKSG